MTTATSHTVTLPRDLPLTLVEAGSGRPALVRRADGGGTALVNRMFFVLTAAAARMTAGADAA